MIKVTDFVTEGNFAVFNSFRANIFYYSIPHKTSLKLYQFQIPLEDIEGATISYREKAITMMKWIRKSIENKTFIKL